MSGGGEEKGKVQKGTHQLGPEVTTFHWWWWCSTYNFLSLLSPFWSGLNAWPRVRVFSSFPNCF